MGPKLSISVDPKGDSTPSEQLASQVRFAIASGVLAPGERLPSVRQLAVDALVNPNTVGKVWRELEREGVLETRPGDGVFVASGALSRCRAARDLELSERLRVWLADARRAGLSSDQITELFERLARARSVTQRTGGQR